MWTNIEQVIYTSLVKLLARSDGTYTVTSENTEALASMLTKDLREHLFADSGRYRMGRRTVDRLLDQLNRFVRKSRP